MSPTRTERLQLYRQLSRVLGEGPADTLMTALAGAGWDEVANGRLERLAREDAGLRAEVAALAGRRSA